MIELGALRVLALVLVLDTNVSAHRLPQPDPLTPQLHKKVLDSLERPLGFQLAVLEAFYRAKRSGQVVGDRFQRSEHRPRSRHVRLRHASNICLTGDPQRASRTIVDGPLGDSMQIIHKLYAIPTGGRHHPDIAHPLLLIKSLLSLVGIYFTPLRPVQLELLTLDARGKALRNNRREQSSEHSHNGHSQLTNVHHPLPADQRSHTSQFPASGPNLIATADSGEPGHRGTDHSIVRSISNII